MRMIAVFEKSERVRHIGHLDIQRAVQRGLRRSGLPVAYSNGFNPHIQVSFASALSTGACGKREIMDVKMAAEVSEAEFLEKNKIVMDLCYARCQEIGGQVSGEHAIGHAKKQYLLDSVGETGVALMAGIKKVFDPNMILNPGKVCTNL